MSQVSGQGTIWNLPNYWGELFTADEIQTPFLTMIGGLNGSAETQNFEFATSSEFDFPAESQPAISETTSLTAPTATEAVRTQLKNVTQIFQEAVSLSYVKLSNQGRLSGINTEGKANSVADENAFQINYNLQTIARDIEETYLNGVYQIAVNAGVANKSRGMVAVCSLAGSTAIAAGAVALSKALMDNLFRTMHANGALFRNMVIWVNGFQADQLNDIYGYVPTSRTEGGVAINEILTNYGSIGIAKPHRFMDTDTLLIADMSVIRPVTQPVPGKGNMFYEMLSKTGASENGQIFGQVGLDYGPAFAHGKITGLTTS